MTKRKQPTAGPVGPGFSSAAKGLTFKPAEKKGDKVRVQLKSFGDLLKVRKWNYREKRWSRWAPYAG